MSIVKHFKSCLIYIVITIASSIPSAMADNPSVVVNIDANAGKRSINPEIYGVNSADEAAVSALNVPLNRLGGNRTSRYNWLENADGTASDYYFESYPGDSAVEGEIGDTFIANSKNGGAEPLITIPMLDWVAKLGTDRSVNWSFSIKKYGAQQDSDPFYPDAGNGVFPNGSYVKNDPSDAGTPSNPEFQKAWVQHMVSKWGNAASGGIRYYILDNEHSIWHETHRDVHPVGANYDEIFTKMTSFGSMIKSADPNALVLGPEEFGWTGYFYSGYDKQFCEQNDNNGECWANPPDRQAHGGKLYMDWLLEQLHNYEQSTSKRALDVFTLHFYPQNGEFSDDVSTDMQKLRNRSTRSLWDPNYLNESWINDYVNLIPRMRNWVDTYYPGTKIGITEYNWGAVNHINGATTQADVLGIFGREGLNLATWFVYPEVDENSFVAKAFMMYLNYDGKKSTFGDTSVSTTVPDPDNVSAYAALRTSDSALTVIVISKYLSENTSVTVNLNNFKSSGVAEVWQLTASNTINKLTNIVFVGSSFSTSVPSQSITLFVIPVATVSSSLLFDDFEDGNQNWLVKKGTWKEENGALVGTGKGTAIISAPVPWSPSGVSGCSVCTFEMDLSISGGKGSKMLIQPWYQNNANRVEMLFKKGRIMFRQKAKGKNAASREIGFALTPDASYNIKIGFDGESFTLEMNNNTLMTLPTQTAPSGNLYLKVQKTTATIQRVNIY